MVSLCETYLMILTIYQVPFPSRPAGCEGIKRVIPFTGERILLTNLVQLPPNARIAEHQPFRACRTVVQQHA